MVRFAQLWLPGMERESPAFALAQAQRWLRTVTNRELQEWRADLPAGIVAKAKPTTKGPKRMIAVRGGRGYRFEADAAGKLVQARASADDAAARPFADPYYWAAFQITGW